MTSASSPTTWGEAIRCARAVGLPRLDAELLLGWLVEQPRSALIAFPESQLSQALAERYVELLQRRASGEPLAHLIGEQEFWGLRLFVSADVLIPRPDTELLVELALARALPGAADILELGTGSGAIALALASERPAWRISAVDRSPAALRIARRNAVRLELDGGLRWLRSDWFEAVEGVFDMIIANPPYVAEDSADLAEEVARFEPPEALFAGQDGMTDLRWIIERAPRHLRAGGWLLLEHGFDQAAATARLMRQAGFVEVSGHRDLGGQPRATIGRLPAEAPTS